MILREPLHPRDGGLEFLFLFYLLLTSHSPM
jgi:hypothetical protein